MVFISHTWGQNSMQHEYAEKSAFADRTSIAWNNVDSDCPQSSGVAVINEKGATPFSILQPRRIIATILLLSLVTYITCAKADNRFHRVRAGETLAVIAKSHGVSYQYLACLNDIANPNRIRIGQRIELPRSGPKRQNVHLKWPISEGWMSSPFGPRNGGCHHGVDIAAPRGTPVRAAGGGKVVFSGVQGGYGRVIIIQHSKRYRTLYAHLKRTYVKKNQRVRRGQRIGKVGSSGRSTGPHLHFEVQENGDARDPMSFLSRKTQVVLNPRASYGASRGGGSK